MSKTVIVEGMKCDGCAKKVTEKLSSVVNNVNVDLANKTATFDGDASIDQLNDALNGTHYSISEFK